MQKFYGIGNLTKEPELQQTPSGLAVCKFTIAIARRFSNQDGTRDTDFFNCVAWRKTAELVSEYCKKGNKIAIVGALQNRSYDAKDGTKRYITEIVVDEVEFLTPKSESTTSKKSITPIGNLPTVEYEELPF